MSCLEGMGRPALIRQKSFAQRAPAWNPAARRAPISLAHRAMKSPTNDSTVPCRQPLHDIQQPCDEYVASLRQACGSVAALFPRMTCSWPSPTLPIIPPIPPSPRAKRPACSASPSARRRSGSKAARWNPGKPQVAIAGCTAARCLPCSTSERPGRAKAARHHLPNCDPIGHRPTLHPPTKRDACAL